MKKWKDMYAHFQRSPAFTGFILFMAVLILNVIVQTPAKFFTVNNISILFAKNIPIILITMGQALLMLLGVIDISIGVQMSLANVIAIMLPQQLGFPLWISWILAFLAVVLISTVNGLIVSYFRIPPLLVGFGMISIVSGINLLIMPKPQGSIPAAIYQTYEYKIFGFIPMTAIILLVMIGFWLYLKQTKLIKYVYAVGGNERNAFANGINTAAVKVKVYVIAGIFTGIAGLCFTAMTTSGNPITGSPYGLKSISACILGGISLAGGWGTMACAVFGSGFLVLIQNTVFSIFSLLYKVIPGFSVNSYWQNLVSDGIILLGLVATVFTMRSQRLALKAQIDKVKGGVKHE